MPPLFSAVSGSAFGASFGRVRTLVNAYLAVSKLDRNRARKEGSEGLAAGCARGVRCVPGPLESSVNSNVDLQKDCVRPASSL